jgi:hypothetical protein
MANFADKYREWARTTQNSPSAARTLAALRLATSIAANFKNGLLGKPEPKSEAPKPTARDPNAECPDCKCKYAYTNFYDECYQCGRGLFDRR